MNEQLVNEVGAPPIVDFKKQAKSLTPRNGNHFDLSQAVPWYPTFPPIQEKLSSLIQLPNIGEYGPVPGLPELRSCIASQHPLRASLADRDIIVTSGANHAIYTTLTTLFDKGEKVVLLEPYYFNHEMAVQMLGLKCERFELSAEDGYQLNPHDLTIFAKQQKAAGIVIVSPNNPTGVTLDANSITTLLSLTAELGIEVILDETYLAFDPTPASEKLAWGNFVSKNLSIVGSFSKSHSLCGFRVGYMIARPSVISEVLKVQDTMIISPCTISMHAALHGLQTCEGYVQERRSELLSFQRTMLHCASQLKMFRFTSIGVFFAYLKHPFPSLTATEAALKLYEETGILALPGSSFGKSQEGYLRLAYCNLPSSTLESACQSLITFDNLLFSE